MRAATAMVTATATTMEKRREGKGGEEMKGRMGMEKRKERWSLVG